MTDRFTQLGNMKLKHLKLLLLLTVIILTGQLICLGVVAIHQETDKKP